MTFELKEIKKDMQDCIKGVRGFKNLQFFKSRFDISPMHFNQDKPAGVITLSEIKDISEDEKTFCEECPIRQVLLVEYHTKNKDRVKNEDWEINLHEINLKWLKEIKQVIYPLFAHKNISIDFKNANVGLISRHEESGTIVSRGAILQFEIKYDVEEVIFDE